MTTAARPRAPSLNESERSNLYLPGDPHLAPALTRCGDPLVTATAEAADLYGVIPTARTLLHLDAARSHVPNGPALLRVSAPADESAAAPDDVIFGCGISSRVFAAMLRALPKGAPVKAWLYGRYCEVVLTAQGKEGMVSVLAMPMRCCGHAQTRGHYFDAVARAAAVCPCRDCAAGRKRGKW